MKKYCVILCLVLLSMACRKTIPLDEKYQAPQTVINGSFMLTDDTVSIFVTESMPIFGYGLDYHKVKDARISLFENGEKRGDFELAGNRLASTIYQPGYGSRYRVAVSDFDPDASYSIAFEHDDLESVSAVTSFPPSVTIDSLRLAVEEVMQYGELETVRVVYLSFRDNGDEENYYQVLGGTIRYGQHFYRDSFGTDGYTYNVLTDSILVQDAPFSFDSWDQVDPLISPNEEDLMSYTDNRFMIFNDEVVNGKSYTMRLILRSYYGSFESLDTAGGEFYNIELNLNSLTQDLYLYYKSVDAFYTNDGGLFSEPVQVYSNIDNGLGIFSAYRQSKMSEAIGRSDRNDITYITYDDIYK